MTALYVVGGVLQLVGIGLVVLEVRDLHREAARHLADAAELSQAYGGIYNIGLGGAQVQADTSVRHLEYLHRVLAASLGRNGHRAAWGAGLLAVGVAANMAAGVLSAVMTT